MALDRSFSQTINLQANGDELLRPLEAFGREINKVIKSLNGMSDAMTSGNHASEDSMRKQVQMLQRLIGEASTLHNILNSSANKNRDGILSSLDERNMGRKLMSASKLRQELGQTTRASDALEVRLGQLYASFNKLTQAGKAIHNTDLERAFNTEGAINQVKKLERELNLLDLRANKRGYQSQNGTAQRADIAKEYQRLLGAAQNPNVWLKNAEHVSLLTEKVRELARAEALAAREAERLSVATRQNTMQRVNMNDAQMLATLQRGASQFRYTPDQAKQFNMLELGRQIDANVVKLRALQQMMSKAVNPDTGRGEKVLQRLSKSWDEIILKTQEAMAQQNAYNNLPENKRSGMFKSMFGTPKAALASLGVGAAFSVGFQVLGQVQNALSSAVTATMRYEDAMASLQAIAGATDQQMVALSASIRDVASNSRYAVEDIATAATTIAQAGFSSQETGEVLRQSLTLAAGSGSTPDQAVDTLTSALGAFNLQASESERVVDTLMAGLNRSKLSIGQMQQAIQYAGATAKENNVQFQELVAITASMANAGLRSGSTIGTGLRQMMVDLKSPTKEFREELEHLGLTMGDIDVSSLGMAEVVRRLTDAGFSAEQAYASFEVRAASAFLAFRNQIDSYDSLALSIAQSGAAAEANERAMDSLTAKWNKFTNILKEGAAAGLEDIMTLLKMLVDGCNAVAGAINYVDDSFKSAFGVTLTEATQALDPFHRTIKMLEVAIYGASSANEKLQTKVNESSEKLASQKQTVSSVDEAIKSLILRKATLEDHELALQAETLTLTTRFEGLASELVGTAGSYDDLIKAMVRYRNTAQQMTGEGLREQVIANADLAGNAATQVRENGSAARNWITRPFFGAGGSLNNPQMRAAAQYYQGLQGENLFTMSDGDLGKAQLQTRALKNDISQLHSDNADFAYMVELLQKRQDLLAKIIDARRQINDGNRGRAQIRESQSNFGQSRESVLLGFQQTIETGLAKNRESDGSGNATLTEVTGAIKAQIAGWQKRLNVTKDQALKVNLQDAIVRAEGMVRQVERDARIKIDELNEGKGPDGTKENARMAQFGSPLAAGSYSTSSPRGMRKHPITGQYKMHEGRDMAARAGTPVMATEDGMVKFAGQRRGYGNIIIIDHGNGLETRYAHLLDGSMKVAEGDAVNKGQKIAGVGSTGNSTGNHLHYEMRQNGQPISDTANGGKFRINPSEAIKGSEQAADKAQDELAKLAEAIARTRTATAKIGIDTLLTEVRDGKLSPTQANDRLDQQGAEYERLAMAQWDAENPTDGMSAIALETRSVFREEQAKKIAAELTKWHAELWRFMGDIAGKTLDAAMSQAEQAATDASRVNEQHSLNMQSARAAMDNRPNRYRVDDGMRYIADREVEASMIARDVGQVNIYRKQELDQKVALDNYNKELLVLQDRAAGSAEYVAALEKQRKAQEQLNVTIEKRVALERSLKEQTSTIDQITFAERLRGATALWMENSGAMDTWGKTAGNMVGPALGQLTSSFTGWFTAISNGEKIFGGALRNMALQFAEYVQQMIMQALALQAVKGILSLIGLAVPGVGAASTAAGPGMSMGDMGIIDFSSTYNGGPAVTDHERITSRYNGGSSITRKTGGGRVNKGIASRDSGLHELAEGEYVVRNKSVRELGLPFMKAINEQGAAGLAKMQGAGSAFTNIQAPKQETNVYVVADKQEAGMGPSDVLVTIQKDILQNGVTKRLIKQVAQGG